jgi:hypothetical protein
MEGTMITPHRLLLAAVLVSLTTSLSAASNTYIAQSAAGSGNGSSCANAAAASSVSITGAGNSFYLCGTISTNLNIGSGASGNPVVLDGTGATLNAYIDVNGSYWTIQNVTWTTGYATNSANQAVIQLNGGWSNGLIQNNHIDVQNSAQAIFMFTGNTVTIQDNYIRVAVPNGDSFDTDDVDWASASNVTLQRNYLEMDINEPDACGQASGGCHDDIIQIWQYDSNPNPTNGTIANNYFAQLSTNDQNLSFCMMESAAGTWNVYGNVFYTTGAGSNDSNGCGWGGSGTFQVYNNTFIEHGTASGPGLGALLNGGSGTMYARNNIFYRDTSGNSPGSMLNENGANITFDHDIFYSPSAGDFPSNCGSQTGNTCSTSSSIASGLFNAFPTNFSLSSGSIAIGGGSNLGSPYNEGIASSATSSASWPNPPLVTLPASGTWQIGAYATGTSSGSAPPPPPPAPAAPTGLTATVE